MPKVRTRRPRDPKNTREAILEAALTRLAADGPEGVSLSKVAHLAGVNRGTAYQHFETREKLIKETTQWASDKLFRAVFGDPETLGERRVEQVDMADFTGRLAIFAMDNPELCRVWLLQVLASPDPSGDPFWKEYEGSLGRFAQSDLAQENIDSEVNSVIMLAGAFLWPIWARSHAKSSKQLKELAQRFTQECLRISMYGTLKPKRYPQLAERLKPERTVPAKKASTRV